MGSYGDYKSRKRFKEYAKRKGLERSIGFDTYGSDLRALSDSLSGSGGVFDSEEGFSGARDGVGSMLERTKALQEYTDLYGGDATGLAEASDWLTNQSNWFGNFADFADYQGQKAEYERLSKDYDFAATEQKIVELQKRYDELSNTYYYTYPNNQYGTTSSYNPNESEMKRVQAEISALREELGLARLFQVQSLEVLPSYQYNSAPKSTNTQGLKYGKDAGKEGYDEVDWLYEYINGYSDKMPQNALDSIIQVEGTAYMTEEERARYNYLHLVMGKDAATQYLYGIEDTLYARQMGEIGEFAQSHPFLGTLGAIGGDVLGAFEALGGQNGNPFVMADAGQAFRSGVTQSIESDIGKFLYNTGVSALESFAVGTLFGNAGGVVLGLSSMASTYNDLLRRGADPDTAMAAGLAAGIFECLFETVSLGQLKALKEVPVNSFKDLVLNIAKSAGVNATEEAATEAANILYDTIANGEFSEAQRMLDEGMSKDEIRNAFLAQIGEAAASGAVMGMGFAGVGGGIAGAGNAASAAGIGKAVKGGESSFGTLSGLAEMGEKYGIKQAAKVKAKGDKVSNRAVGDLYRRVSAAVARENQGTTKKAITARITELGAEEKNAEKLADVVLKKYMGQSLSFKESVALDKSKVARQALSEMLENANSKWVNELRATLMGEASRDISTISDEHVAAAAEQAAEIARSEGPEVQAASGESLGEMPQIASLGLNGVMLAAPSGEVALDDTAMPEDKAFLYTLAGLLPSAEIANAFVQTWDGNTDPAAYFKAYQMIYTYGRHHTGYTDAQITEAGKRSGLGEAQISAAFKSGVQSLAEERRMERERLDGIVAKFRESGANRPEGKWDATGLRGVDLKKVSKENLGLQDVEQFVAFLRMTTKAFGWNVRVIADKSDKRTNGGYDPATNTLTFNVYAGTKTGTEIVRTAMPNTISHETVHWMKRNAPEQYQALEDMVLAALKNANDYDFGEAVLKEYGKYKEKHGQEITDSEAREEIVARACEDLFGRSEAIQQFLVDFANKNKEAATGFTAAVKKILAKIKEFFENLMFGHGSRTLEAGIVRKCGADVVQGLQEQYEKTFFAALEGNAARNALGEFEQGGVRYSLNENAATELHKALYDTTYSEEVLLRDESPAIMRTQKGVKNLPMAMNASHIRENVFDEDEARNLGLRVDSHTHYHGLGETFFLKIIDELDSVTEAYRGTKNASNSARRENYFLLVSKLKDKDGNVINVPVYIDELAQFNRVFIDVNKISTAFGRTDFYDYLKRQIKKGNLVRIKNRSISTSEPDALIAPRYGRNASAISIAQKSEKSTPDAKKLLEDRVSGDDLLNAQDLIADVQELGGQVDEYGYITLYHRTSAKNADAIHSTGDMVAKEDGLFFSTKIDGQNVGYGDTVVTFSIPAEKLLLDDVFDDEAHLRFPLNKPGRVSMQEYLVNEDAGDTGLHSDPEDDIDNRTFSYNELVAKGDLQGVVIGKARQVPLKADGSIDDDAIVKDVKSKCQTVTTKGGTTYFVSVPDIGRNVEISKDGIVHGFIKLKNKSSNALPTRSEINARAALEIPQILANSIEVNRSQRGNNLDVPYTHVMMGTVAMEDAQGKFGYYAVRSMILERKNQNPILVEANVIGKLYAVNAKKIGSPHVRGTPKGVALAYSKAYAYSIADFLQDVKGVFDDTFSLDVYNRLGVQRKASEFSQYLLHSDPEDDVKSDREILAGALMSVAQNEIERNALKVYQGYAKKLDEMNARLREVNAEIRTMMFQRGTRDEAYTKKLEALKAEKDKLEKGIARWDSKLFSLEVTKSLQDLLDREKQRTAKLWIDAGRKAMNNYREKQLCRVYTQKIEEKAKNLRKMLLENSEKYHVPDAFKKPVAAFLSLLDFSSERTLQGGELTKKDMELQAAFEEVVTLLELLTDENSTEYVNGLDLPPDAVEEFVALSKEVAQMAIDGREGDTMVLRRMSSEQLKTLNTTLYAMTRAVRQANDLFANERFRHVSELSLDFIGNSEQYAAREKRSKISDFLSWENMVPYYAFRRLGAAGEALFKGFMQGQDKFAFLVKEIIDFTEKLYTEQEVKAWEREVHTFDGTNGKVYITTAQIMSLYELWKDKDARQHILGGGGRIQDIDLGIKKKYANDPNGTALGDLVVDAMFAKLTPRQKAVADSLQKFMAEECAKWGNEISYKRWGIRIFGLDYYFPIESDRNTVKADVEQRAKESGLFSLLHKSFTKKRVFNANNRIMVRSVFDVFSAHTTDMAKYSAFALPLLDMQKFINFKEIVRPEGEGEVTAALPAEGEQVDTSFTTKEVRASMEKAFGTAAYKYIEQFLIDLNGNIGGRSAAESILQKGITAHKIAAVGANLRVALLQPTAYVRLLNVMSPKYFFGGLRAMGHLPSCIKKMQEHAGIALWKSLGYRDTNIAAPIQTKIKHDETWRDKVTEKSMILAEMGDKVTWGCIWYACELETRDKHADLKVGSEEYYRTVAERFTEAIYATQVVDSTFTKSQIMRKKDFFATLFTSFMSEPTLSYNLLAANALSLMDTKRRGEKITKAAAKPFVRAVGVFAIGALLQAAVESLIDAARGANDDEEYGERYFEELLANTVQEIVPLNLIPVVKDIWSIALATIKGDYMQSSRMDLEVYNRIAKAVKATAKMFEDGEVSYSAIYKILTALSSLTGLPISNLVRDVIAIWNVVVGDIAGGTIIN